MTQNEIGKMYNETQNLQKQLKKEEEHVQQNVQKLKNLSEKKLNIMMEEYQETKTEQDSLNKMRMSLSVQDIMYDIHRRVSLFSIFDLHD